MDSRIARKQPRSRTSNKTVDSCLRNIQNMIQLTYKYANETSIIGLKYLKSTKKRKSYVAKLSIDIRKDVKFFKHMTEKCKNDPKIIFQVKNLAEDTDKKLFYKITTAEKKNIW